MPRFSAIHLQHPGFRRARLGALAGALALLLAACGGGDESAADPAEPKAATVAPADSGTDTSPSTSALSAATAAGTERRMSAQAATAGSTTINTSGIGSLFTRLGSALASPSACAGTNTGMAAAVATQARLETPRQRFNGRAQVAAALCAWAAEDGLWGATLAASPATRCAQREGQPVCRVNVDLQPTDGSVRRLGRQLAVTQEAGAWKLLGHVDALQIDAFAVAQRERRLDSGVTVDRYNRSLVIGIPALPGLACARVTQSTPTGQRSTLALYKPFGGLGVQRLSLWRTGPTAAAARSLDPRTGDLRVADDAVLPLPDGSPGDTIVHSLVRDGGSLRVSLHADAACSTPLATLAVNEFEVGVDGVPPLSTTLAAQAWPQLSGSAALELRRLGLNSLAGATITSSWTGLAAGFRPELAMLCVDDTYCAPGEPGRFGERALARSASLTTLTLKNRRDPVVPADFKLLALAGRHTSGLVLLADFHSCAATPAGKPC